MPTASFAASNKQFCFTSSFKSLATTHLLTTTSAKDLAHLDVAREALADKHDAGLSRLVADPTAVTTTDAAAIVLPWLVQAPPAALLPPDTTEDSHLSVHSKSALLPVSR